MNQVKSIGASQSVFNHSRPNETKSSRFDLSRILNTTYDPGMIMPIDLFEVYPGDVVDIDLTAAIDTLPLVAPSLTQYKFVTHWYFQKKRDQWKGFKTMATRGRSGNITDLKYPMIDSALRYNHNDMTTDAMQYDSVNGIISVDGSSTPHDLGGNVYFCGSHSLSSLLGAPSEYQGLFTAPSTTSSDFSLNKSYLPYTFLPNLGSSRGLAYYAAVKNNLVSPRHLNALPFVMYQSIVKNNYVNQNLLQNNKSLFPDEGDDDWLLPYDATVTNFIDKGSNSDVDIIHFPDGVKYRFDGVFTDSDTVTRLDQLRYAMFDDDYFTTGLPWVTRGKQDTLTTDVNLNETINQVLVDVGDKKNLPVAFFNASGSNTVGIYAVDNNARYNGFEANSNDSGSSHASGVSGFLNLYTDAQTISGTSSFTLNQLRSLIAMSVWQERNARVNGSYNEMIYQHWQQNPHSEEHAPVYIGGTSDYINFNSIIQQSESSGNSPLGTQAGYGSMPTSKSKVCQSFKVDDYGYIMGIMIIKPITYYQQGTERYLLPDQAFTDIIYPEFQTLSPEPVYIGELYCSYTDADNLDLFNYQERMTYAKVRQNVNRGLFQVDPKKDIMFSAMTQARWFDSKPEFSYQFLCMSPDNMRRDHLAFPSLPMFRCQLLSEVFVNRRLAYTSMPNTFGF